MVPTVVTVAMFLATADGLALFYSVLHLSHKHELINFSILSYLLLVVRKDTLYFRACSYISLCWLQTAKEYKQWVMVIRERRHWMPLAKGQLSKNNLRKIEIIFLSISLNMCFGCSKEPSHRDGSFEYPQQKIRKNNFQLRTLIWRPALSSGLTHMLMLSAPLNKDICSKLWVSTWAWKLYKLKIEILFMAWQIC